jgi:bifunctional DNase/RNase
MAEDAAQKVNHIHVIPTQSGTAVFLVLDSKTIVIQVDPQVGEALLSAIQGKSAERPLTHDLMLHLLQGVDSHVEHAVISDVKDGVFFARIVLRMDGPVARKLAEVDARPSDSLVLAVKAKAPVFVAASVVASCDDMAEALARLRKQA